VGRWQRSETWTNLDRPDRRYSRNWFRRRLKESRCAVFAIASQKGMTAPRNSSWRRWAMLAVATHSQAEIVVYAAVGVVRMPATY